MPEKKCGNVSLNLLFPILLSAPVESSWEKALALPKEDQDSSIEGRHAMSDPGGGVGGEDEGH